MKNLLIIIILAFVICSCDKEPIDANIIGSWKRVSYVTISGADSSFSDYSEEIYHFYNSDGTYDEVKSGSSIYTSNANYTYTYSEDILTLKTMDDISYTYPAVITGNVMIVDLAPDGNTKCSYMLSK